MDQFHPLGLASLVAPHAGAWIEMVQVQNLPRTYTVAPHAGAWIEIKGMPIAKQAASSRSPRGSVD